MGVPKPFYFNLKTVFLVRGVDYKVDDVCFLDKNPVKEVFPEKEISGWVSKEDYPNWEELENIGVNLSDEQG